MNIACVEPTRKASANEPERVLSSNIFALQKAAAAFNSMDDNDKRKFVNDQRAFFSQFFQLPTVQTVNETTHKSGTISPGKNPESMFFDDPFIRKLSEIRSKKDAVNIANWLQNDALDIDFELEPLKDEAVTLSTGLGKLIEQQIDDSIDFTKGDETQLPPPIIVEDINLPTIQLVTKPPELSLIQEQPNEESEMTVSRSKMYSISPNAAEINTPGYLLTNVTSNGSDEQKGSNQASFIKNQDMRSLNTSFRKDSTKGNTTATLISGPLAKSWDVGRMNQAQNPLNQSTPNEALPRNRFASESNDKPNTTEVQATLVTEHPNVFLSDNTANRDKPRSKSEIASISPIVQLDNDSFINNEQEMTQNAPISIVDDSKPEEPKSIPNPFAEGLFEAYKASLSPQPVFPSEGRPPLEMIQLSQLPLPPIMSPRETNQSDSSADKLLTPLEEDPNIIFGISHNDTSGHQLPVNIPNFEQMAQGLMYNATGKTSDQTNSHFEVPSFLFGPTAKRGKLNKKSIDKMYQSINSFETQTQLPKPTKIRPASVIAFHETQTIRTEGSRITALVYELALILNIFVFILFAHELLA